MLDNLSREEIYILARKKAGGGGDITVESLSVTENGTYTAPSGKAYSPVSVNVPQTTIEALSITENGEYTAPSGKAYSPINVNVPLPENAYYLKESASANPLSITDGEELKCQSALVTFAPKQSGTGDPSPSNIRPISGWDGLVLTRTGKNRLAKPFVYDDSVGLNLTDYFFIEAGTYIFTFDTITASSWRFLIRLKDKNGNILSDNAHLPIPSGFAYSSSRSGYLSNSNVTSKSIVLDIVEDCYIRILFTLGDTSASTTVTKAQLEIGSTATDYEPYSGSTHTATFPSTIMGGSYDFVSGEATNTMAIVDLGTLEWFLAPGGYFYNITDIYPQSGTTKWISSALRLKPSSTAWTNMQDGEAGFSGTQFRVKDSTSSTANEFKQKISGVQLCYELATPTPITLTPADVNLLKGLNTVWTDGDTVQLEYWSKSN